MEYYNKSVIDEIREKRKNYYVPDLLFDGSEYKIVRVEVKWAFVACLNVLIDGPLYDHDLNGFIKDDNPMLIDTLKKIANKKVDKDKMDGYLDELEDYGLIERVNRDVYLRKVEKIF